HQVIDAAGRARDKEIDGAAAVELLDRLRCRVPRREQGADEKQKRQGAARITVGKHRRFSLAEVAIGVARCGQGRECRAAPSAATKPRLRASRTLTGTTSC